MGQSPSVDTSGVDLPQRGQGWLGSVGIKKGTRGALRCLENFSGSLLKNLVGEDSEEVVDLGADFGLRRYRLRDLEFEEFAIALAHPVEGDAEG